MAQRKKAETEFKFDASAVQEPNRTVLSLSDDQMRSVIRLVKTAGIEVVKQIETATKQRLSELGEPRRHIAVKGIPEGGSNQMDLGTFKTWTTKVTPEDEDAFLQLTVIDSAAHARLEG